MGNFFNNLFIAKLLSLHELTRELYEVVCRVPVMQILLARGEDRYYYNIKCHILYRPRPTLNIQLKLLQTSNCWGAGVEDKETILLTSVD